MNSIDEILIACVVEETNPFLQLLEKKYTIEQVQRLNKTTYTRKEALAHDLYVNHARLINYFKSIENILYLLIGRSSAISSRALLVIDDPQFHWIMTNEMFDIDDIVKMIHVGGASIIGALYQFLLFNLEIKQHSDRYFSKADIVRIVTINQKSAAAKRLAYAKKMFEETDLSIPNIIIEAFAGEKLISTDECLNILGVYSASRTLKRKALLISTQDAPNTRKRDALLMPKQYNKTIFKEHGFFLSAMPDVRVNHFGQLSSIGYSALQIKILNSKPCDSPFDVATFLQNRHEELMAYFRSHDNIIKVAIPQMASLQMEALRIIDNTYFQTMMDYHYFTTSDMVAMLHINGPSIIKALTSFSKVLYQTSPISLRQFSDKQIVAIVCHEQQALGAIRLEHARVLLQNTQLAVNVIIDESIRICGLLDVVPHSGHTSQRYTV